jgi:hypothetical protein
MSPHRHRVLEPFLSCHRNIAVCVWAGLAAGDSGGQLAADLGRDLRVWRRARNVEQRVLLVRRQVRRVPEARVSDCHGASETRCVEDSHAPLTKGK